MHGRALLPLALMLVPALGACVADTDDLLTLDGGVRPRPDVGVLPGRDASEPLPDGGAPDATAPDATACGPGRSAITIPVQALELDLAPSGDRLLILDGTQAMAHALPSGRWVQQVRGPTGVLVRDGRTMLVDVGGGELVAHDEQAGGFARVTTAPACDYQITPDRRFSVAVVDCRDVPGGAPVGRLEIVELATQAMTTDDEVLVRSVRATPQRDGAPRIAYQRRPQGTACSRCPTNDAEVVELTLTAAGDAAPPPTRRFIDLLGYGPNAATLVASSGICGCGPDSPLLATQLPDGRPVVEGVVRSLVTLDPLDTHGTASFAQSPSALGEGGLVLARSAPAGDLIYAPYDGASPAQVLLPGAGPSISTVLSSGGRDRAVLTSDAFGRLLRVPLALGAMPEVVSPPAAFGVSRMVVSEDRGEFAFVVESGGQVIISELFMGTASGPVSRVYSSGEPIELRGLLPGRRGALAVVDGGALRLFRGDTALDIDGNVDPTGPLVTDAQGCWVAHRRAGAMAETRVVPLP